MIRITVLVTWKTRGKQLLHRVTPKTSLIQMKKLGRQTRMLVKIRKKMKRTEIARTKARKITRSMIRETR